MITVYVGDIPRIQVDGEIYDRHTPTYVTPRKRANIWERDDFEEYDPKKNYTPSERVIYVNMPNDFSFFIGSINFLKYLKELYPLSDIEATCRAEWAFLISHLAKTSQLMGKRENFYRSFDLHLSKEKINPTLTYYRTLGYEQIQMELTHTFEIQKHKNYKPEQFGINKQKSDVVIFHTGDKYDVYWKELSKELKGNSKYKDAIHVEKVKYDEKSLKEYISIFGNAKHVIFCGDSSLATLAAYAGCSLHADCERHETFSRLRKISKNVKGGISENRPYLREMMKSIDASIFGKDKPKDSNINISDSFKPKKDIDNDAIKINTNGSNQDKKKKKKNKE